MGIALLCFFIFVPPLTRKWSKNHLVNYPSVIPAKSWKKFSSAEGNFSIWFPGKPEYTNVVISASGIEISQPCFFVWADSQTEYAVNYCDYPKVVEKLTPEQQFDSSQAGVAKALVEILYQQNNKFENYPARDFEFVARGKANFSGRVRLILKNDKLYQIMVVFLTANPHSADRDTFFNSFRLQN